MHRRLVLVALLLFVPALDAAEEPALRREAAAVAKVEAVEKLVYLPRREALSKLKVVAKLILPGKHAVFDRNLGEIEVWLEEPEFARVERRGSGDKGAEDILPLHDGKKCVRRDLVDFAVWPFAIYPNADRANIEFAPKSRTRVRIFDPRGTGVEVTFARNGLPKQHTYYEKGKRQRFDKLEYSEYGGVWLLDRRTAQGGKDETRWHWEKREGLWLPKSIDRTLGRQDFRIDLDYRTIEKRPEGTPPKLPPRSDPAAVAALERAERLVYRPVDLGVEAARLKVTVSDRQWKGDQVFLANFAAPKTGEVTSVTVSEDLAGNRDRIASIEEMIHIFFLQAVYYPPPVVPAIEDRLVTRKPGEERTYLVSDRKATETEIRLDKNGAFAAVTIRNLDRAATDLRVTYRTVDGKAVVEESRQPATKSTLRWTWEEVDGIWLPKRVVVRVAKSVMAMTASDYEITKNQPKAD